MHAVRFLLLAHRRWSVLLCALALALRVLVPGGYMPISGEQGIAVVLCPGFAPAAMAEMDHAMPADGHAPDGGREHGPADVPCAFSGLSAQALSGIDPVPVAPALAFAAVPAWRVAARPAASPILWLRPPLRGPPFPG